MPSQLALLLCISFVVFLLWLDRKQSPGLSLHLWLPTVWMILTSSRSIDVWLGVSGGNRYSGGVLDPVLQSALLCVGFVILLQRGVNLGDALRQNRWVAVLLAFMLVSVLWSDILFVSFKRWVREIVAFTMALLVLTEKNPREAVESILRRSVYVLVPVSVLMIKYYPDLGVTFSPWTGEIQWVGASLQKNGLGRICLTAILLVGWTLIRRWQGRNVAVHKYQTPVEVLLFLMTLWLIKGPSMWAASATAIASLVIGLLAYLRLLWASKRGIPIRINAWTAVVACLIGLGIVTPIVGGATVSGFSSLLGRDATLTGRTDIWASLVPEMMKHPIFGFGFGSFWTHSRVFQYRVGEAHNGYLDATLDMGLFGVLLIAGFLLATVRKLAVIHEREPDWAAFGLCFILMTVVHNFTETSVDSFGRQLMAICLFVAVATNRLPQDRIETRAVNQVGPDDTTHKMWSGMHALR